MNDDSARRSSAMNLHLLWMKIHTNNEGHNAKSEAAGLVAELILGMVTFAFLVLSSLEIETKFLVGSAIFLFFVKSTSDAAEVDLRIHALHTEMSAHFDALHDKVADPQRDHTEARLHYLERHLPTNLGGWRVLLFYWLVTSALWIGGGLGIAFLWKYFRAAA